jgi:hypothetical protein
MIRLDARKITPIQQDRMQFVLTGAQTLEKCIDDVCHDSHEKAIALTKLEECVMWANYAISHENI